MNHYHLDTAESYKRAYQESLENPEEFWAGIAKDNFLWQKPLVAAMPNGIDAPGRLRNIQADPFVVRGGYNCRHYWVPVEE